MCETLQKTTRQIDQCSDSTNLEEDDKLGRGPEQTKEEERMVRKSQSTKISIAPNFQHLRNQTSMFIFVYDVSTSSEKRIIYI